MSIDEASESHNISYARNIKSDSGDCCFRHLTRAQQSFIPYDGSLREFKRTEEFSEMMRKHDFVLLEPNVFHCVRTESTEEKVRCKRGINISTFDRRSFHST